MTPVDDTLLARMVQVIVDEVDPEQVILFGSRARGDADADSDVDLIVIESAPFGEGRDRDVEEARLWRALASFHVPKDLLSLQPRRGGVLARLSQQRARARYGKVGSSMSDPKQARLLLAAAERDFAALRGMGDATIFADEIFGFHAQQATEKLLKAWLASLGETYPLSHDLASLLDMLARCTTMPMAMKTLR